MGPHTTADDPTRYRDPAELDAWKAKDPIARVESLLSAHGALTPERAEAVAAVADRVAAELRAACVALPDPDPMSVFDNVYAEAHTGLTRRRDHYSRYLRTFVGGDGR
ncbi:thiamine pyrophosphate-dependent enzyme [Kitasatospora herbaricolor]|uniref:thiamine pyrophosphate-dependent enzyme n=1 Tax=Kitasatospora herbaricolor TaxID=68217 RepID=UPI0036D8E9AF